MPKADFKRLVIKRLGGGLKAVRAGYGYVIHDHAGNVIGRRSTTAWGAWRNAYYDHAMLTAATPEAQPSQAEGE